MTTEQSNAAQQEWDGLLEQEVTSVEPPSYMQEGEIINRPSEESPLPMRVHDLAFKGYVEVWDNRTGVKSLQPWWLLWQTMRKTREDGSLVFTRVDPQIPPDHGDDLTCPLNPESSEWPRLKRMGFRPCRKGHIPHQDGLNRHVRKSHQRAWEAMEREREDRIREEDRKMQREMLEAMTGAAVKGIQADQQPAPPSASHVLSKAEGTATPHSAACEGCGKVLRGKTPGRARANLNRHLRQGYCPQKESN